MLRIYLLAITLFIPSALAAACFLSLLNLQSVIPGVIIGFLLFILCLAVSLKIGERRNW